MKIVSVEWLIGELNRVDSAEAFFNLVEQRLKKAADENANLVVLPAYTGAFLQQLTSHMRTPFEIAAEAGTDVYLSGIMKLASKLHLIICPGSFWEKDSSGIYHTSCIISDNKILLMQRQLYLARWERKAGLERGQEVSTVDLLGFKTGIILSTDVFYPQVSRNFLSLKTDLILSPVGFICPENKSLQLSGMWQEVQQNLFYAVESGFNGTLAGVKLWGKSIIHAPLDITPRPDGILAASEGNSGIIAADLDYDKRLKFSVDSDVLAQFNPDFYRKMNMFGGGL